MAGALQLVARLGFRCQIFSDIHQIEEGVGQCLFY